MPLQLLARLDTGAEIVFVCEDDGLRSFGFGEGSLIAFKPFRPQKKLYLIYDQVTGLYAVADICPHCSGAEICGEIDLPHLRIVR